MEKEQEVFVMLNLEEGWDCVVGVYGSIESLKKEIKLMIENYFLKDLSARNEELNLIDTFNMSQLEEYVSENFEEYVISQHSIE